jgi:hypothetical protein
LPHRSRRRTTQDGAHGDAYHVAAPRVKPRPPFPVIDDDAQDQGRERASSLAARCRRRGRPRHPPAPASARPPPRRLSSPPGAPGCRAPPPGVGWGLVGRGSARQRLVRGLDVQSTPAKTLLIPPIVFARQASAGGQRTGVCGSPQRLRVSAEGFKRYESLGLRVSSD